MMRIAFLADGDHPNGFRWAEYYASLGAQVAMIGFHEREGHERGVEYIRLNSLFRRTKLRYLFSARNARGAISAWKPDILIGYRLLSYGYLAARTGFRPLVLAAQGQNLVPPGSPGFYERLVGFALRNCDLVHAWSNGMAERMVALGGSRENVIVRPRGVKIDKIGERYAKSERPTMISTRQLEPYYNQRLLIEVMADVLRSHPEAELILCGTGSDRELLDNRARELGIEDRVRFKGFLGEKELMRELDKAWLYLSAVPTDGVSASLLEAMERGCFPVVVDNAPNRMWITNSEQGALFRNGDKEGLAKAINNALSSPQLRQGAARINRQIVMEQADYDRNMKYFLGLYENLVAARRETEPVPEKRS